MAFKVKVENLTNYDLVSWIEDAQRSRVSTELINRMYLENGYAEKQRDEDAERTKQGLPTEAELLAEQALREELCMASPTFQVGTVVKIGRTIRGFNRACAAEPKLGQQGTVTDKDRHGQPFFEQPDPGFTPVLFDAQELGYEPDPEFQTVVYFIPNYALTAA